MGHARRSAALVAALAASLVLSACLNDLTPQGRWSSPATDGEYIYVGNLDGVLVRLEQSTNAYDVNWLYPYEQDGLSKKPKGLGAIYGAPTIADGNVFAAGYTCRGSFCEAEVFGVSPTTGNVAWNSGGYQMDTKIVGALQSTENGLIVFGTSAVGGERDPPGYLYAINQAPETTRRVAWRVPLDGEAWGDAAIDSDRSTAYIGTDAGTLYAVDLSANPRYEADSSARIKWTFDAAGSVPGPTLVHDGHVYFGDLSGRFYRLNPSDGSQDWVFEAGNWVWAKATPDSETGMIYVGTLGGDVYAIDAQRGTAVWSQKIDGQIVGAPLLFERSRNNFVQRVLAVPSGAENVYILHASDGQNLGVLATDAAVKSSPRLINDLIYVHTLDGDLMWFATDDQTLQGCVALKDGGRCG